MVRGSLRVCEVRQRVRPQLPRQNDHAGAECDGVMDPEPCRGGEREN